MAKVLIIGGFQMSLNDGSAYWALAQALRLAGHDVRERECMESGRSESIATSADVEWADHCIVYSYGCATLWKRKRKLPLQKKGRLVIIAGVADEVPDAEGDVQNKLTLWHAPEQFDLAICFDVKDEPISSTLKNDGVVNVSINDPIPQARWVNVSCDRLYHPLAAPGDKHKAIKENPTVLGLAAQFIDSGILPPPAPPATSQATAGVAGGGLAVAQ